MKKRSNRAVWAAVSVLALVVAGSALGQTTESGKPVSVAKVDLGGKVAYDKRDFSVVGARRPIAFQPFTVSELLAAAPAAKVKGTGDSAQVLVHNNSGDTWVPVADYVKDLNRYEQWVAGYGYSLRDGALAPQVRATSARPASALPRLVVRDLGLKFRLKPIPKLPSTAQHRPFEKAIDKNRAGGFELYFVPEEILGPGDDPTRQERATGWNVIETPSAGGFNAAGAVANGKAMAGAKALHAVTFEGKAAGAGLPTGTVPVTKVMSGCAAGPAPEEPCTLEYGKNYTLSQHGQDIVNNVYVTSRWQCTVLTEGAGVLSLKNPCTHGGSEKKIFAQEYFASDYPGLQWLNDFADLCKYRIKAADGTWTMPASIYKLVAAAQPDSSSGTETVLKGTAAPNFYDGTLSLKVENIKDCFGQTSDNGWFAAYACSIYESDNHYTPTDGFLVDNSTALDSQVGLFGLNFTLLSGKGEVVWKQKTGANKTVPKAAKPTISEASTKSQLDPFENSQTYAGPSAIIPIGPVPLTITSSLTAEMHLAQKTTTFAAPAITDPVAGQDILGTGATAGAGVHVNFDAGIDAVVASAGVEGQLDLIKASIDGTITSTIDTGANKASVDRVYALDAQALSGSLSAFVEVDLLVYSKRWSVELANFNGIDGSVPADTRTWTAQAVLPKEGKPCP